MEYRKLPKGSEQISILGLGNSSLGGAAVWLTEPGAAERMERIIAVSEEIPLASDKDFNQFYMDSMFFEV